MNCSITFMLHVCKKLNYRYIYICIWKIIGGSCLWCNPRQQLEKGTNDFHWLLRSCRIIGSHNFYGWTIREFTLVVRLKTAGLRLLHLDSAVKQNHIINGKDKAAQLEAKNELLHSCSIRNEMPLNTFNLSLFGPSAKRKLAMACNASKDYQLQPIGSAITVCFSLCYSLWRISCL